MRKKRAGSLILAAFLVLAPLSPFHAVNAAIDSGEAVLDSDSGHPPASNMMGRSDEPYVPPLFSAKLVESGKEPGIYGTLSNIPADAMSVDAMYSFDGIIFYPVEDVLWDRTGLSDPNGGPALTLWCIGIDQHPLTAYLRQAANSLYVRMMISRYDNEDIETNVVKFTHGNRYPPPDTPPDFSSWITYENYGYLVTGRFQDFPPDVIRVQTMYSLDGVHYQEVNPAEPHEWYLDQLGAENEWDRLNLEEQACIMRTDEPLKSYLAKALDRFYVRLQITTEAGTYDTKSALIDRGAVQPLPADKIAYAVVAFSTSAFDDPLFYPYAQYQLIVRENATPEQVRAFLPDTLPVKVQLHDKATDEFITAGVVDCAASWKTLPDFSLTAGETLSLSDMANELVVPAGSVVITPFGSYILPNAVAFGTSEGDQVRLAITAVGADEPPRAVLRENSIYNTVNGDYGALSLAFWQKPTGATAVHAYALLGEGEQRIDLGNLLDCRELDRNHSAQLYGYVNLLWPEESPFREYLAGEISNFSIELKIEGGAFDGETLTLPWPGVYEDAPQEIPDDDGSEGNRGDVGSQGGEDNGGQRPHLPGGGGGDDATPRAPDLETATVTVPDGPEQTTPLSPEKPIALSTPSERPVTNAPPEHKQVPAHANSQPPMSKENPSATAAAPVSLAVPPRQGGEKPFVPIGVTAAVLVLGSGAAALYAFSTANREKSLTALKKALQALRHKP